MARILFDAFFHQMPGHRIGDQIAVGGYAVNFGRYSPGDCYHPNGLAMLQADLAKEHELRLLNAPYSDMSLAEADILLVTNPDYPLYDGAAAYRWTPKDVDALLRFAERGGGVLLLVNSFLSRPDYWEENFDYERVSLLFDRLGVRWDPNYMSDDNSIEPAQSGKFCVGYGQGGRVWQAQLPEGIEPLLTYNGNIYGFFTNIGKGKLAVIGDTGAISNGLICFPGFENAAFFRDLFARLSPAWGTGAWDYRRFGHISCAPSKTGLNEEILRGLRPDAEWMDDHHYRHLTWNQAEELAGGQDVWAQAPLDVAELQRADHLTLPLHWVSLDGRVQTPEVNVELTVERTLHRDSTELHAIGRTEAGNVRWADLSAQPERLAAAGIIEKIHTVFEMTVLLDTGGRPRSARWSQGQILYAWNPNSLHYGWEIVLNSDSGIIVPRAG